jgi:ribosomal-protein-alanine N-acetyltransferase
MALPEMGPDDLVVHLTPMRRRHLRHVTRIEQQVYPRPWSLGLFLSELSLRGTRLYLVARVGSTVVGYAGMMLVVGEGHVTTLAVDPAWHRHKVGTRLLLALLRWAVDRGATALTLEVRVSNQPAQALYRGFGFAPAGMRKNYYVDTNEDAIVMWAHDVGRPEFAERLRSIEAGIPGRTSWEGLA